MDTDQVESTEKGSKKGDESSATKPVEAGTSSGTATATGKNVTELGVYKCSCKDTIYERPPPRSFRKWHVKNLSNNENYELIVHCSHKVRGNVGELLLEPIPEYQIEMGGTKQPLEKVKSLALSLKLRRNASLLNVRVDNQSGDVLTFDNVQWEQLVERHGPLLPPTAGALHAALDQLKGLLPGYYVLQHHAGLGSNAMLYVSRARGGALALRFQGGARPDAEDAAAVKVPPALEPVLLPIHKYRKILPLAFTPHQSQVAKEPKKPVTRQKTPPQALKWPKRKRKAKRKT